MKLNDMYHKRTEPGNIDYIVSVYSDLLYRMGIMLLKNRQDAEDAVQEVLIRYIKKAPDFADSEQEKAWLLRVMINLCKDMLRYQSRRKFISLEEIEDIYSGEEDDMVGHAQEERIILEQMQTLPSNWRIAMILHCLEGYSEAETAKILHISENAVKKRIWRGRRALKKKVEEMENGYK